MISLNIPFVDGTYPRKFSSPRDKEHDIGLDLTDVTSGTLTIRARKPGSTFFEDVPDGVVNLASPHTVTFFGAVREYEFTLASVVGTTSVLEITDTSTGGE